VVGFDTLPTVDDDLTQSNDDFCNASTRTAAGQGLAKPDVIIVKRERNFCEGDISLIPRRIIHA
jgi:hypothetical protein